MYGLQYHFSTDNAKPIQHLITYFSRLVQGSQLNWAALIKDAYAVYMAVKKLNFYLEYTNITLWNDHLPLRKFLYINTLNIKVTNWTIELMTYRIRVEFIKAVENTIADTLS